MKSGLNRIYQRLHSFFGPQHWWPAEEPFEVMVGAILTQNTSWSNVEKAINNLKDKKLLTPKLLFKMPVKRLAVLIRPAGYYNIKAARLKNFLDFLFRYYQGDIGKMSSVNTRELRNQLLSVNGIGQETADSILLYALDKPIFVVDAYTRRIFLRHGLLQEDYDYSKVQAIFMQGLPRRVKLFNEYHALLVRLGKEFCLKRKPRCQRCPLGAFKLNKN